MELTVNDTSPTILYTPFGDTFSTPNLSAGWNPYYTTSGFASALGDVGVGTSLHITSNNGSSLVVQWHGTGIQLWGNATSASYAITLDGAPFTPVNPSDNVLANIDGLADAPHAVTLTAVIQAENPPNSSMIVFEKAVIMSPAPANVSSRPETIDDNDIAFLGRWSFRTTPSGSSFHSSRTLGDRAVITFNGTTFLLQGITSPHSGNYTVTLDNVTTSLSGRSSFTSYNSLLFFATGLDPTSTHSVQVTNSGGSNLSLLVGGFTTFMSYNASTPSPSLSLATTRPSFSKGTIAAFVLAGILGFVIFSGLIFYFFVYRPRRRRRRVLVELKRRSHKECEAGVLDIGPEVGKTAEFNFDSPFDLDQQNRSVKNGFSRWRRGAVDGSPGELSLPIRFRHSDSSEEKLPSSLNDVPLDDLSKSSSNSSTRRKARAKSKGKARQITGRSWSPGITLELPIRRSRRQSSLQPLSPTTESVGYVSTFVAAEPSSPKPLLPPSYAASISIRDSNSHTNLNYNNNHSSQRFSNMPSVPRSVSPFSGDQSYLLQSQDYTGGFVLHRGELNSERNSSAGSSPHRLKPPQVIPMGSRTRDDRGSAVEEDNLDENQDIPLQQAIRSLSPRTVRHPYAYQDQDQDSVQAPPSLQEINLPEDNAILRLLPEAPSNDDDLVEVRDGVFLSVRTPSPFQLTFDTKRTRHATSDKSNSGELSYLSASSHNRPSDSFEPPNPDDGTSPPVLMPTKPEFFQGASNMRFRLTPLSIPPTSVVKPLSKPSNGEVSESVTSFLDFTSSREGSLASRSVKTTWSEEKQRGNLYPATVEGKSRWSNATVPSLRSKSSNNGNGSSGNGSSGSSRKVSPLESQPTRQSSTFPMPVRISIPPSTYHAMGSSRRSRISGLTQTAENLHVHPFEGLESPTDSVPMSVSELHFRQSISEENMGFINSRRTTESSLVFVSSRPPLPTRPDEFVPRPFDPSILVNRVLGLSPTISTLTARPTTGYSSSPGPSPGPFASSPSPLFASLPFTSSISPFTSRHDTNSGGDRSNSRTDSLGP